MALLITHPPLRPFSPPPAPLQVSRVIERTFHLDSTTERDEWMTAYKSVKQELDGYRTQSVVSVDERMRAVSFIGGKITKIQMTIDDFDMLKVGRRRRDILIYIRLRDPRLCVAFLGCARLRGMLIDASVLMARPTHRTQRSSARALLARSCLRSRRKRETSSQSRFSRSRWCVILGLWIRM